MMMKKLHDAREDREQASHAHECHAFARLRGEEQTGGAGDQCHQCDQDEDRHCDSLSYSRSLNSGAHRVAGDGEDRCASHLKNLLLDRAIYSRLALQHALHVRHESLQFSMNLLCLQ